MSKSRFFWIQILIFGFLSQTSFYFMNAKKVDEQVIERCIEINGSEAK